MVNIYKILNSNEFDAVEKIELLKGIVNENGNEFPIEQFLANASNGSNASTKEKESVPPIRRLKKADEYSMTQIAIKRRQEYLKNRNDPEFLKKRAELNRINYQKRKENQKVK